MTQPKSVIPANIVTNPAIPIDIVADPNSLILANIVTEPTSVIQANSLTQPESFLPKESLRPFPSSSVSLPPPDNVATPDIIPPTVEPVEASNGSDNSKPILKRGKRSSVPSGKGKGRIKKCGLSSCVPCSFDTDCGKCLQCTNKKMK